MSNRKSGSCFGGHGTTRGSQEEKCFAIEHRHGICGIMLFWVSVFLGSFGFYETAATPAQTRIWKRIWPRNRLFICAAIEITRTPHNLIAR